MSSNKALQPIHLPSLGYGKRSAELERWAYKSPDPNSSFLLHEPEQTMQDKIYTAIKGWAGIFTWHTGHPLDTRRFHAAITNLYTQVGANIDESALRAALIKHRTENSEGLGGKPNDETVQIHVERAITILSYLADEGRG